VLGVLLVGLAALLVLEAVLSLRWRLMHDVPLVHYVAFVIDRFGFAPYRDIFDMGFPGIYLFHWLIGACCGYGDVAARIVDLSLLAILSGLTWGILRPLGRWIAGFAVVLFGLSCLQLGPAMCLQRDFIGLVAVVGAVWIAMGGRNGVPRALAAGLLFGAAAMIKPHLAIGLPLVLAYMVADREEASRRLGRSVLLGLAAMAGFAVPVAAAMLWLWQIGSLPYFVEMVRNYLPLYLQLNYAHQAMSGLGRWLYLLWGYRQLGGWMMWLAPALLGAYMVVFESALQGRLRRRVMLLMALLAAYSVYPVLAGQFWVYHWIPFQYFVVIMAPLVLVGLRMEAAQPRRGLPAVLLLVWACLLGVWPNGEFTADLAGAPPTPPQSGRVDAIVEYLRPRLQTGDTVQPLDWTGGAVQAMLVLEARIATPYMYDFHFYHHVSDPYIQTLRQRFISGLQASRPRFVIQMLARPMPSGPDTTREFPELTRFLAENYQVASEGKGYTILERKAAPVGAGGGS
jgi:hypothetical protein